MARMTTARAIVRSLVANGIDTVFGLPGVQLDALFNALHDERDRIRVIHPRHEQAAAPCMRASRSTRWQRHCKAPVIALPSPRG